MNQLLIRKNILDDEWRQLINKPYRSKRTNISYLQKTGTGVYELIYTFRHLVADIRKNNPVYQLMMVRSYETIEINSTLKACYGCGYTQEIQGRAMDYLGTDEKDESRMILSFVMPSRVSFRNHPFTIYTRREEYSIKALKQWYPSLKYVPDQAFDSVSDDITYFLPKLLQHPVMAEMLGKMNPQMLRCENWLLLDSDKAKARQYLRYSQEIDDSSYSLVSFNISHQIPSNKALKVDEMNIVGRYMKRKKMSFDDSMELLKYFRRQQAKDNYGSLKTIADEYDDYLKGRKDLGMSSESHSAMFPSSLRVAHHSVMEQLRVKEDRKKEEERRKQDAKLDAMMKELPTECGNSILMYPHSNKEMVDFGTRMDNCIGRMYTASGIISNDFFIFLIGRMGKDGNPEPYLACELIRNDGRMEVHQLYRKSNKEPSEEERKFVDDQIVPMLEKRVLLTA